MSRKPFLPLLFPLILLTLTGCWDRREMNDLAITLAMGIDRADGEYMVTTQVVQPGEVTARKAGNSGPTPVTIYQAKATTLFEAIRRMTMTSPRKIYGAHLRVVVIGESLAREGVGEALDLLSRDYELRTDFHLMVAKGSTAAESLNVFTPLDKLPANKLYKSLQTAEKAWAPATAVPLDDFIADLVSRGRSPVLSGVEVRGDAAKGATKENLERIQPAAQLENAYLAVFRKDRLIGWLNEEDSKGYSYIVNKVKSTVGHISCPQGGHLAVQVIRSKAKMNVTFQDGKPKLSVNLHVEQNVGEVECRIDLTRPETIEDLEKRSGQRLEQILSHALKTAQTRYKTDYFGFGNSLHRSDPAAWEKVKSDWDRRFSEADFEIKADVKIGRTGTVTNSFMKDLEE